MLLAIRKRGWQRRVTIQERITASVSIFPQISFTLHYKKLKFVVIFSNGSKHENEALETLNDN